MPVSDEHALRQFEIEALRQITDNLKRLNDGQAEQLRALHGIDNRLTRIESNSVNAKVTTLEGKVDALESDRDKRVGAIGAIEWLGKHWPLIALLVGAIMFVLRTEGKLG